MPSFICVPESNGREIVIGFRNRFKAGNGCGLKPEMAIYLISNFRFDFSSVSREECQETLGPEHKQGFRLFYLIGKLNFISNLYKILQFQSKYRIFR